jgi:hypothetical protein
LGRGIVGEEKTSDEALLAETKIDIKKLIEELENRKEENEA